ncbi:MAG TPA: hypothetical protein VMK53_08880 [Gemmatimonadales bacterium]|nr:hypothetical protein [Gemmatimonadales bacterium]
MTATLTRLRESLAAATWGGTDLHSFVTGVASSVMIFTWVAITPINNAVRVSVAFNWAEELKREWQAGGRK